MTRFSLPYLQNIFGVFSAALEAHLPVDILSDWQLTPEMLQKYRVIVLPNTAATSDEASQALEAYVEAGGGLMATFESSLFDETARRRRDFSLARCSAPLTRAKRARAPICARISVVLRTRSERMRCSA